MPANMEEEPAPRKSQHVIKRLISRLPEFPYSPTFARRPQQRQQQQEPQRTTPLPSASSPSSSSSSSHSIGSPSQPSHQDRFAQADEFSVAHRGPRGDTGGRGAEEALRPETPPEPSDPPGPIAVPPRRRSISGRLKRARKRLASSTMGVCLSAGRCASSPTSTSTPSSTSSEYSSPEYPPEFVRTVIENNVLLFGCATSDGVQSRLS